MNVKFFIPLLFIILLTTSCNQAKRSESEISSSIDIKISKSIDSKEQESLIINLELMGKLWGFLKYFHPEIGKGNYDWDDELFQVLPSYLEVNSTGERDELLLHWIEKYGEIPECKTCKETSADAVLKPDFSWVEEIDMSALLKAKIMEIYQNRFQGEHYYIRMPRQAQFLHENPYAQEKYPNTGLRLLALYRYWNMIQYFFPYKHLTDTKWSDVLKKYIPEFVTVGTITEYKLAALQLITEICDTHAHPNIMFSLWGDRYAPFTVKFVENRFVVYRLSPQLPSFSHLNVGDIITHVNGKEIESIVDSLKIFIPASNDAAKMRVISHFLLCSWDDSLLIDFISSNNTEYRERFKLYQGVSTRAPMLSIAPKDTSYKVLEINNEEFIGYVTLATIKEEDIIIIKQLFKDSKGIIIDIRNYPNTPVYSSLGSFFASEDRPYAQFTYGNINNPGEFNFRKDQSIRKNKEPYKGKLVVIVNEWTQSQAETTAMVFRAGDHTTIIGSQTSGANGDVSEIILPGDIKSFISGVGVYYPDGSETQRLGIVPDIEVKPTIKGIREGRDELFEKAIEIIIDSKR